MKLQGKVAAITGGARGIGHATAVKFAAEGARVAVCDINPQLIEETLAAIRAAGGEAAGYRVDARTCFLWEGVINYLTAEAVDATFCFIGSHSAPGSRVAFTYPHAGILDGSADFEGARELAEYVRQLKKREFAG